MTAKRLLDIAGSLAGLIVLSPLLVIAMAAIRMETPGPIVFRQPRVGRYGAQFHIHKLRTMYVDQPPGSSQITIGRDPRITRVGRVLRQYKIDELVQLIDVLRGAMSLVGPRPEVPKYVEHYPEVMRQKILSVHPGITDLSSLKFFDEAALLEKTSDPEQAYIDDILPQKLAIYADYVDSHSFRGDLAIILATVRRIFS